MTYWDGQPEGKKKLLRLLTRDGSWLRWEGEKEDHEDPSKKPKAGCMEQVEEALLGALHSTNVVVLLGSGASFSANNASGPNAPGMWHLWKAVKGSYGEAAFDDIVNSVIGRVPAEGEENIEALLSLCKMSIELLDVRVENEANTNDLQRLKQHKTFVTAAEKTILAQVGFVRSETELPAHTSFLRKFARRSPEKPRVKLFNFDHDIVRRAASSAKADYLDGVFHLYKLHGSVDWRRRTDEVVIRSLEDTRDDLKPVLIYPRSSKYQEAFQTPYLDMFASLQAALREPDTTLIVSGFGFADDHISAPIWSAIETNLSLRLVLCDRGFVEPIRLFDEDKHEINIDWDTQRPYQKKIARLVQQGDTRITMLNGRFEDFADALPMIAGKTDRQLLQDRLEKLREVDRA